MRDSPAKILPLKIAKDRRILVVSDIHGNLPYLKGLLKKAAFSGSDETGYMYIIGSKNIDLRSHSREINAAINGKGGGTAEMIRGRASTSAENIQKIMKTPVV